MNTQHVQNQVGNLNIVVDVAQQQEEQVYQHQDMIGMNQAQKHVQIMQQIVVIIVVKPVEEILQQDIAIIQQDIVQDVEINYIQHVVVVEETATHVVVVVQVVQIVAIV